MRLIRKCNKTKMDWNTFRLSLASNLRYKRLWAHGPTVDVFQPLPPALAARTIARTPARIGCSSDHRSTICARSGAIPGASGTEGASNRLFGAIFFILM